MPSADLLTGADPCTQSSAPSSSRIIFFIFVFLIFIPGGAFLFVLLSDRPYGVQAVSVLIYTAGVILYTFSANRGMQRYFFDCPFVRPQLPRLARRHAYFLVALIALQTALFQLRPHLSPFWVAVPRSSRGVSPFGTVMVVLCAILLLIEIMSNRSLLDRAHKEKEMG